MDCPCVEPFPALLSSWLSSLSDPYLYKHLSLYWYLQRETGYWRDSDQPALEGLEDRMKARPFCVFMVLLLLVQLFGFGEGTSNPGFIARITKKGIEYGKGVQSLLWSHSN